MKESSRRNVSVPVSAAALALLTVAVFGHSAHGQVPRRSGGSAPKLSAAGVVTPPLSPQVQQQMELIAQEKRTRTPAQRKMSSALVFAARIDRGQPAVAGVPSLRRPQLDRDMIGRVLIDIKGTITPGLQQAVEAMGGQVVSAYPRWNAMRAWVGTSWFELLAQRGDIRSLRQADKAHTQSGSVTSQGDTAHGAVDVRSMYGAEGANSKVGVLSDSVRFLANSVNSGDLPNNVQVLDGGTDISGNIGEGTAMLEIVHDLAPAAQLAFKTGFRGEAAMAQSILDLANADCNIIVDDIGYLFESPFQDGPISQAINQVAADGRFYFSSAGNQRDAAWEGDFTSGGQAVGVSAGLIHRFPSGRTYDTISANSTTVLNWADPLAASNNDYDLYALNAAGTDIMDLSTNIQDGTQDPLEAMSALAGERLVVVQYSGENRAIRLYAGFTASLGESTVGSTFGHSAAAGAFGVAAADATLAGGNPFSFLGGTLVTESFSSTGPRRVFFHPDGSPITPGNFLFATNGGVVRNKPDFTAADRVRTSVSGFNPFIGTSAAAPHAAAMTAQLRSLFHDGPTATQFSFVNGLLMYPSEVVSALANTTLDIETPGWDSKAGGGVMMIDRAVDGLVNFIGNLVVLPGANNVTFMWTTSVPAGSEVFVSVDPNDPNPFTVSDPTLRTVHVVTVEGLSIDNLYFYGITAGSESGAVYGATAGIFETYFMNPVVVTGVTATEATISWRTGLPANSKVTLSKGLNDPNPMVIEDATEVTDHVFTLTDIEEETEYYVTVYSETSDGISGDSSTTFTTLALQEVLPIEAILLNKNASTWQLQLKLQNRSKYSTITNLKIDHMVLNVTNTRTPRPTLLPNINPDSILSSIFLFPKLKIGTKVTASVTGSYTTKRTIKPKRFSRTIDVLVL